ncbi:MAG: carbamoyl phosphate synthase large subunit, partial [Pirellulaceae bacterium]|nr:carbamoyl phosphate synthase large subunit [Pirellulaceae bacterium]
VPFVAKATGKPIAGIASKVMVGTSLAEQGVHEIPIPRTVSVKESVFPFRKFIGVDIALGPEMRSTGEVMGSSPRFSIAYAKSLLAAGIVLPDSGRVFVSVADRAKERAVNIARDLNELGFEILATGGTAKRLEAEGIPVERVKKLVEGHPNLIDHLKNETVDMIFNTPKGKGARTDEGKIRAAAVQKGIPCITTIEGAETVVMAIKALRKEDVDVESLQERFEMDAVK